MQCLQGVGDFIVDENSSFRGALIFGRDAAGSKLGEREESLSLIPGAEETVHVEVCHGLRDNNIITTLVRLDIPVACPYKNIHLILLLLF